MTTYQKYEGVSPDAPVTTNADGGKQSSSPYAFQMLPVSALFAAAKVAKQGAEKYGETFEDRNYIKIDSLDHINHAIAHIYAYLGGDTSDDHLAHALVRLMFAVDTVEIEKQERIQNIVNNNSFYREFNDGTHPCVNFSG